ncbi:ABC transporter substrate-binding protein [Elusimicrobiota bacterium]
MKKLLVLLQAGFIVLMIGSCGKKDDGKTTLSILLGPDIGGAWKTVAKRFEEKHPDISIDIIEGSQSTNSREDLYTTSFLSGESSYDLVYMDIVWLPKFTAQGWLLPLDKYFTNDAQKDFLPGDMAGSRYKGSTYRVPMQTDAGMLYYRKDLLDKAGFKPPKTWEELLKIAKKLQKPPELWGFVFQGKQYEGVVCDYLELLWGNNGKWVDENDNVHINSPQAIEALSWLADALHKHKISPPGVSTYEEEEARLLFQEGRAVFMRNWPYAWVLAQGKDSPIKGKVGIIPMVHGKNGKSAGTLGGWGVGIAATSKHHDEAWKFIEFASSQESLKTFHFTGGMTPTRKSLFKDPEVLKKSPHYKDLYKVLMVARPRPPVPYYAKISDILQVAISLAMSGDKSAKKALEAAEKETKKVIEQVR